MNAIENQTIALAGMMQSCKLVQELAYKGQVNRESAFEASIGSLFRFEPEDTADTFGGPSGVGYGLDVLGNLLQGASRKPADMELTRYGVSLIAVTKQFLAHETMAATVHDRLTALSTDYRQHGVDSGLTASINQIYRETISTLPVRLVVNGEKHFLDDLQISARIRALLLAGIRATVLWQQVGGSRWQLLLRRGRFIKATQTLGRGAF